MRTSIGGLWVEKKTMAENRKILMVDTSLEGHHQTYLQSLIHAAGAKVIVCAPDGGGRLFPMIERYDSIPKAGKSWKQYLSMMMSLRRIVRQEKPDILHFVYMDAFYRFGGIGMRLLPCKKIITCHQFRHRSKTAIRIYRRLSRLSEFVVVHTDELIKVAKGYGIHNAVHVEYPQFNLCSSMDQAAARAKLGIPNDGVPLMLSLGGTRYFKGLDLLLTALKDVTAPFYLLVAGKEESFTEEYIREAMQAYQNRVFLKMAFLSEEEVDCCLQAADIVCLPYRRQFDGASGPLGEGAYRGKMIVGPAHGSIGQTIREHHLGLTFEAENIANLTEILEQALTSAWEPDEKYREYQKLLNPKRFEAEYAAIYQKAMQ